MRDITYCVSIDCQISGCDRRLNPAEFQPDEMVSVADFSGVCRGYIARLVDKAKENGDSISNPGSTSIDGHIKRWGGKRKT